MGTPFELYQRANARLDALIDTAPIADRSLPAITARAQARLARTGRFLRYLGDPHRSAPVIHVAGTSGKGSTATTIARILRAAGYRTLLHTSPYLQVSTEKLMVDDRLIDAAAFAGLVDEARTAMADWGEARLTYAELWMALIGLTMARVRPDVAIVEVGAGGRFDLTNLVESEVAVITTIGLDHTETLGETIREIAWHKAGIIKAGAKVVHAVGDPVARNEIEGQARAVNALVHDVVAVADLGMSAEGEDRWSWQDRGSGERLVAGLSGRIQVRNAALAVAAVRAWRAEVQLDAIRSGLAATRLAARFERMRGSPLVILDGAHNPQKMSSLAQEVPNLPQPRIGVLGFLAAKRADEMLAQLAPHLDEIVLTSPDVVGKPGLEVERAVAMALTITGGPVSGYSDPVAALDQAMKNAETEGSVIVTGSLFLCGAIRERWYPREQIVIHQTQWPDL